MNSVYMQSSAVYCNCGCNYVRKWCHIIFDLDLLFGTNGRLYKQEDSASSAFSIFTKNVVVTDYDSSVDTLIVQPCFGYGYYVGLVSQNDCD